MGPDTQSEERDYENGGDKRLKGSWDESGRFSQGETGREVL